MTDIYAVYNALIEIMCDRCAVDIRRDCHKLPDSHNFTQKIRCMKEILEAQDHRYPAVLLKVKSKKGSVKK